MQAFRLCRSAFPAYDGEGARRVGGRWNSKGTRLLYTSENRSLAVLEILVHLSSSLPDKFLLGVADIPDDIPIEKVEVEGLPENWGTLNAREQLATKRIGDEWAERRKSAILAIPSVIVGELNYVLNPAHLDFGRISFAEPVPFRFDVRLIARKESGRQINLPESRRQQ
jgi:RES domain-containing protein